MGDSSDEDVIRRQQKSSAHARKRNLEDLFEEQEAPPSEPSEYESDSFYDYVDTTSNATLRKIFGTGKEYAYIFDQNPKDDGEKGACLEESKEAPEENRAIDVKEVSLFVKSNIAISAKDEEIEDFVEMVLNGMCVQFVVLHCPTLSVKIHDAYKIYDLVEYYRQNVSVIGECKRSGTFSLEELAHLRSTKRVNALPSMDGMYRSCVFLSVAQFKENIQAEERIFEPTDPDVDPVRFFELAGTKEEDVVRAISQEVASCPFFRVAAVNWAFENGHVTCTARRQRNVSATDEEQILDGMHREEQTIREYVCGAMENNHSYEVSVDSSSMHDHFSRLYLNGGDAFWNKVRDKVLQKALASFNLSRFLRNKIDDACKNSQKTSLFNHVLDRVVNGRVKIESCDSVFAGVAMEKREVRASLVNYVGELVEQKAVSLNGVEALGELFDRYGIKNVYTSGHTSSQVKHLFKIFRAKLSRFSLHYVEGRLLRRYPDAKEFTQNIARMVISPETEYAYLMQNNVLPDLVPNTACLSAREQRSVVERALTTALSLVGVDVNVLLESQRKQLLLQYIPGFVADSKARNYGFIEKLQVLRSKEILDERDFRNAATFLRVFPELHKKKACFDVLDSLPIHPENYRYARMCCAAVLDYEEIDDENPSKVVEEILKSRDRLLQFDIKPFEQNTKLYPVIELCIHVLAENTRYFDGLPDEFVFKDLLGDKEKGSIHEGHVVQCGQTFYLVDVNNEFTVFIRRTCDLYLNQAVKVKLVSDNYSRLSFEGSLVEEGLKERHGNPRFYRHPLFRNLNVTESENYLRSSADDFIIRKGSKQGYCVLVIKFASDVFVHLKIEEHSDHYTCSNKHFEDIDEVISVYVRPILRNLKSIKAHAKYFSSPEDAEKLLSSFDGSKVVYAFYFSRKYPGKLTFAYNNGSIAEEYIGVSDVLTYDNNSFRDIDSFIAYRKRLK